MAVATTVKESPSPIKEALDDSETKLASLIETNLKVESPMRRSATESQHWLIYKQEEMPNYIVEAKKRLGQIKEKFQPPMTAAAKPNRFNASAGSSVNIITHIESREEQLQHQQQQQQQDEFQKRIDEINQKSLNKAKHWLTFENPSTPENVREIRRRLGDDRYKRLPASYARSKTCIEQFGSSSDSRLLSAKAVNSREEEDRSKSFINAKETTTTTTTTTSTTTTAINNELLNEQENVNKMSPVQAELARDHYKIPYFNPSENFIFDSNNNLVSGSSFIDNNNNATTTTNNNNNVNSSSADLFNNESTTKMIEIQLSSPSSKNNNECETKSSPTKQLPSDQQDQTTSSKSPSHNAATSNEIAYIRGTSSLSASNKVASSGVQEHPNFTSDAAADPVPIPFESWLKTASDAERSSVLRILSGMESPRPLIQRTRAKSGSQYVKVKGKGKSGSNNNFRLASANLNKSAFNLNQIHQANNNSVRTNSFRVQTPQTRKLGTTRNLHLFPCDVCEKMLVKKSLWEIDK